MLFLPDNHVIMLSILLAFLFLAGSTRAFEISVPGPLHLNEPVNATWTRSERDQGHFVFALLSVPTSIPSLSDNILGHEILGDVPNLSSGTISINFTHPGVYVVAIGTFNTNFISIKSSLPVVVLGIDKDPTVASQPEISNPQSSASPSPPNTAPPSTTSASATSEPLHHASSFSAFSTLDPISSSSSSAAVFSPSAPVSADSYSSSSSVSSTSGPVTIPSTSIAISSSSAVISTTSQSASSSPTLALTSVSVSSSTVASNSLTVQVNIDGQSTSFSPSSALSTISVSSLGTAPSSSSAPIPTDSQSTPSPTPGSVTVLNTSSTTSSPLLSIPISSSLNSIDTNPDSLLTTSPTSFSSAVILPVASFSAIDITTSTSIAASPTSEFTSGTLSSATSSQVVDHSSMTITSDPEATNFGSSLSGATGPTFLTNIPSSTSILPTSYPSNGEETYLPQVLGGTLAALSILLFILGFILYWRHQRRKASDHDIEAHENLNGRPGSSLLTQPIARTLSPQSFSSAYISSRSSSIDSIDEIVRLLEPDSNGTGPDHIHARTHESHESESSDIVSQYSYHSLSSNPFLDSPDDRPPPEPSRPNAMKRESAIIQTPARSGTQKSNGTTDSGTSRQTSRPESYFFMFVDGVMQPLDSDPDRYSSRVLSSECSHLMPEQLVLQERADALREEIVWLRRKVSSLPSDRKESEELLATIRMREEAVKRLEREINEDERGWRRSDGIPHERNGYGL